MEQFDIQFVEKSRSFKQNRLEHFPRVVHNLQFHNRVVGFVQHEAHYSRNA